jgi:signal transduction histidine kinase
MTSSFFVFRVALARFLAVMAVMVVWHIFSGRQPGDIWGFFGLLAVVSGLAQGFHHTRRTRTFVEKVDRTALASRHRRQLVIPLPAGEAFPVVENAIRELPFADRVQAVADSLQVSARVKRRDAYVRNENWIRATIQPGERTSTVTLIAEPEGGAWLDWILVDDATNLENIEAVSRAITRRISERRKGEEAHARSTSTEKELAEAKLSLLHAQVEPHFLYNTLASAQYLTRSDPSKADQMLGNLITYLRRSLPRTEESASTLGEELERATAYLEILRIRMGERLRVQIQVPDALKATAMPPMMLQTLVENAIKHGLEPVTGGGTIWILAREDAGKVTITVADDGRGFSNEGGGTGIGLKNVRERLRLAHGDKAAFAIVANFPKGVAATITLPGSGTPSPPLPQGEGRTP